MKGGALNRGKELILRRVWVRFQPSVTPPRSAFTSTVRSPLSQLSRRSPVCPGRYCAKSFCELTHGCSSPPGDRLEDVAGRGKPCLHTGKLRVNTSGNDAAHAGDQLALTFHGDDAGGGPDDIDDVTFLAAGSDRVPVRIEGSDRDGNSGAQTKPLGPTRERGFRRCCRR